MELSFGFWQKWLLAVSVYITAFGAVLAFFGQSAPMNWMLNDQINALFWPEGQSDGSLEYQAWIFGVVGGCMIGWGICLIFLARYPFANREIWAWQCIAIAMTLWFVVDTSLSLYYGAAFNAGYNVSFYLLFMVPLILTRRDFFK